MKDNKKNIFAALLKKRKKLSNANKDNIKTISLKDPQLMDIIKNFNESKEYEILNKR